jgi:hypothetical protein
MTAELGFTPCAICHRLAAEWRYPLPPGDDAGLALETVAQASVQALFGLHLQSVHPDTIMPVARLEDCGDCWRTVAYVTEHGAHEVVHCGTTAGELLDQHLLGHLVEQLPAMSSPWPTA